MFATSHINLMWAPQKEPQRASNSKSNTHVSPVVNKRSYEGCSALREAINQLRKQHEKH